MQGRIKERGPCTYGSTAKNDDTACSMSEARGGLAITAAAVVVVLPYYPPVLVCNWHYMIRSPWMSRPPDHSFAFPFNIYKPLPNLLHLILATL